MKKTGIATVLLVGIMLIPLLALAGFIAMEPAVHALNNWACAYTGHAYLSTDDSVPVPDGTPIRAIQGSTPLAQTTTGLWQGYDDNEFYFDVNAEFGTAVNFEIWVGDWLPASETAIHGGLTVVLIDLHTGTGAPDPSPTPTPTPTPTSTPTPTPSFTPTPTPTPSSTPTPTPSSTPATTPTPTPVKWQDEPYDADDPYYTYDYVMFVEQLVRGAEASTFNITVGINWQDNTPRVVLTGMVAKFICPDYGAYHINIAFFPSTFTLEIGQTQLVEVAVSAKETAEVNNYIIQIEGVDLAGGTPPIRGFSPVTEGWCRINPSVLGEGCFIATAAYGTSTADEIDTLRAFRDEVLLESILGSQLVEWYYKASPPVADFISRNSLLKTIVRELVIDPIVGVVEALETLWED